MSVSNCIRGLVLAGLAGLLSGVAHAQAAGQGGTTAPSALPADIDPASGNRLPLPNRADMNESDRKLFDEVMKVQEGGLASREKQRPQVRLYSPTLSKGLSDAHHYLKYDTGFGDRITTIAVLTTARELTNQFEWTQWEEHARNPKDSRYVEPKVIDAIKFCRPVTDLDVRDAAVIAFGRELFGARKVEYNSVEPVASNFVTNP